MRRIGSGLLVAALLVALVACSGSDKDSDGESMPTVRVVSCVREEGLSNGIYVDLVLENVHGVAAMDVTLDVVGTANEGVFTRTDHLLIEEDPQTVSLALNYNQRVGEDGELPLEPTCKATLGQVYLKP